MKWYNVFILQAMFQPCLQVLLTTDAERTSYWTELGGDVVMGCRFFPLSQHPYEDLTVSWHWISPDRSREVYRMDRGQEQASFRHPDFRGRARLLTEQIKDGWAKLQVSRLRINDTGTYQCVIRTTNGADYKDMKLSVTAPFKTVTKNISKSARGGELVLSCQSEGYPVSTVTWEDAHRRDLNASATVVLTEDRLFRITTQIRVGSSQKNNYTCGFDSSGSSATFLIPDDTQLQKENKYNVVVISACIGIALIGFIVVFIYLHQKGLGRKEQNTPTKKAEEEKITIFTEENTEDQQKEFLKGSHKNNSSDTITGWKRGDTCKQDLPRQLLSFTARHRRNSFPPTKARSCKDEHPSVSQDDKDRGLVTF
ncbi:programmed cell death 1 ligand 1-like isoform X2 [Phyllopteryx taeniolatus]|uniref:programmed cell death 1 ligand 1-like isoform X2 n=1 Tax=Phyllopteryx taeniolatus TaxID=161469 RepID=UPI002AD45103|nr:programmed cell death 1 ligand 1-like isoform X2 [Phyllopteryx taeniolatus]